MHEEPKLAARRGARRAGSVADAGHTGADREDRWPPCATIAVAAVLAGMLWALLVGASRALAL
jgi:hypothetical protein